MKCRKCGLVVGTRSEMSSHLWTHRGESSTHSIVSPSNVLTPTPHTPSHAGSAIPHVTPPQTIPKTIRKVAKQAAVEVCAHCPQCGCPLGCISMPSECPRCGVKLRWSDGTQSTKRCPGCGFPKVPEGGKVCPGCGAKLKWT